MQNLNLYNPFNSLIYHEETVSSTMDISRSLAAEGAPHGTVITADFQETGYGRVSGRSWEMERGLNLAFTILLKYPRIEDIPAALTLRTGLAVSLAIEDIIFFLQSRQTAVKNEHNAVLVKWPNDIMIGSKKAAGILCEADGGNVHLGIGINTMQREFPKHLADKATSIFNAVGSAENPDIREARFFLLERTLTRLYDELETPAGADWKTRLEQRLFKKDEQVLFIDGAAGSGKKVKGRLTGIGAGGELLIRPDGEKEAGAFITGELSW